MDQLYYESGYIDQNYYVYTAEADVQLTPYIVDYIESNYYEERGAWYSLYAEGIVPTAFEGEAALSVTATVTAVIGYFIDTGSTQSSAFTQSTTAAKTVSAACEFGALFAPSITAEGFRNHTAVLDSAFTIAIDAVANKAATLALANIVNVSSQGIKTAVINSNLTTTVTQSTTAQKTSTASSTQSSAFTQSVDALNLQFGQASLSTAVRFSARGFKRYERPWQVRSNFNHSISSTAKFGAGSLTATSNGYLWYYASELNLDLINIEFWHRQTSLQTNTTLMQYVRESDGVPLITISKDNLGKLSVTIRGFNQTATTANALNSGGNWQHIIVSINTGNDSIGIFVDGSRVAFADSSQGIGYLTGKKNYNIFARNCFIDEFRVLSGGVNTSATTCTVPSQPFTNDGATQFLAHYNTDFEDDIALLQSGQAALTSAFTQSAQAIKTISAASNFATAVAQSTTATKVTENPVAMSVTAAQTTDNIRVRFFDSSQSSAFTESAIIGSIKQFDSTNNALFTPSITAEGRLAGISVINAVSTISIAAVKTTDVDSVQLISVTQTTTAEKITDVVSTQSSAFTQTADAERTRGVDSATSSAFTQASQEVYNVGFGVLLTTAVTISADVLKLKRISSDLSLSFTQSVSAVKQAQADSTQSSQFSQSLTYERVREYLLALDSAVNTAITAVKTTNTDSSVVVQVFQSTTAVKTVVVTTTQTSIASQFTATFINATGTVLLESQFAVTANVGTIKYLDSVRSLASTGVQIYSGARARLGPQGTGIFTRDYRLDRNATISFWVKRNLNSYLDDPQTIIGSQVEGPDHTRLRFNYYYSDVRERFEHTISWDYFAGGGGATWIFATSIDDDWHHFLLRMNNNATGGTAFRFWDLWVDGQYISEQRNNTLNNTPRISSEYLGLGYQTPFGADPDISSLDGALAQVWIGNTDPAQSFGYQFAPTDFYLNGPVDFGLDGRSSGNLPAPKIYNILSDPFTAVNFIDYGNLSKTAPEPLTYNGARAYFTISATGNQRTVSTGSFGAVSSLTASAVKTASAQSTQSIIAAAEINSNQFTGIIADFIVTATETANIGVITGNEISESVTVTLSATIGFFQQAQAQLSDQFDFVCDFEAVPPTRGEADLVSAFTLSADAQSFTDAIIINTAFGTLVCDITVIPPIRTGADLTVTATMSVTIGSIEQFAVLTASLGTMTIAAVKTASAQSTQSVIANTSATPTKFTGIILTLYAFDSVLVAGDVINLDPYLTLWIKPESRTYEIPEETRIITILQETRVNIIEGYSQ